MGPFIFLPKASFAGVRENLRLKDVYSDHDLEMILNQSFAVFEGRTMI